MPKPYLLNRPTGVYARFLVPADLRERIGSRFLVRALHALHGDESRLVASSLALMLSQVFEALRRNEAVGDIDRLLSSAVDAFKCGKSKTWGVVGVATGGWPLQPPPLLDLRLPQRPVLLLLQRLFLHHKRQQRVLQMQPVQDWPLQLRLR